jgi:hypothetical protein
MLPAQQVAVGWLEDLWLHQLPQHQNRTEVVVSFAADEGGTTIQTFMMIRMTLTIPTALFIRETILTTVQHNNTNNPARRNSSLTYQR